VIVWRTGTARLLPRLLKGRRSGPVFLTDRRARVQLPPSDLDPDGGQARLSYRRAAELFEQATRPLANPGIIDPAQLERRGGWSLHQLRHSALTHAAEDGANTATLLSYSGHTAVASLARYAPSPRRLWPAGNSNAIQPVAASNAIVATTQLSMHRVPGECW
jgi:integrase/recombinase XerC/integrase/recombinase XerD